MKARKIILVLPFTTKLVLLDLVWAHLMQVGRSFDDFIVNWLYELEYPSQSEKQLFCYSPERKYKRPVGSSARKKRTYYKHSILINWTVSTRERERN